MQNKFIKMLLLNSTIILVNVILFSNAFFHLSVFSDNAFTTALAITDIIMSVIIFFVGNYKILSYEPQMLPAIETKNLSDCYNIIRQNINKKTFAKKLEIVTEQIKRFYKKKETINAILLQKFSETEMTYSKFANVLNETETVIYQNTKSMLNRINAFDEDEYISITRSGNNNTATQQSRLTIFNEYIKFADESIEDNEHILLKLDQLLFEISKFNSLEDGEVENMSAMRDIDELIHNAKWYKQQ